MIGAVFLHAPQGIGQWKQQFSVLLVQEYDKGLVNKINSTMTNTIPLWRQQLATAVTVFRSPSGMSNGLKMDLGCNLLTAEGADPFTPAPGFTPDEATSSQQTLQ